MDMDVSEQNKQLLKNAPGVWLRLKTPARAARDFEEVFRLSPLRERTTRKNPPNPCICFGRQPQTDQPDIK